MSFAAPLVLLGLALIPALVVAYGRHQRMRGRAAAAFSAPHLAPSVAPTRPGWRRHVPMAAFALALALILIAAARPQTTVAVPVEHASILLMTDVSGSMQAQDVRPSRLIAARRTRYPLFLGEAPIMAVSRFRSDGFIRLGGRVPAPIISLRN